jgi:ACS family sodium-dependent inorganic phosphate cotransporter
MNTNVENVPFWKRRRYLVVLLSFFGTVNIYVLRINLSIAIVSMIDKDFEWNSKEIGLVLSSSFYGYITTQVIGGYLSSKIGGNIVSNLTIRNFIKVSVFKF